MRRMPSVGIAAASMWAPKASDASKRKFGSRVVAVDVGAGVGLRVAQLLRLLEDGRKVYAAPLDLGKDVVAGAVEDAEEGKDPVARDTFAQDGVDGNSSADACLHGEGDAGFPGLEPEIETGDRGEFLVCGDDGLAIADGGLDDFAGGRGAADQFGDDVDVGAARQRRANRER